MLAALRHLVAADAAARAATGAPRRGRELGALTVGIVGFGAVGRASPGGCSWLRRAGCSPTTRSSTEATVEPRRAAAASRDVVSLHLPGRHAPLVDAALLARLQAGAPCS